MASLRLTQRQWRIYLAVWLVALAILVGGAIVQGWNAVNGVVNGGGALSDITCFSFYATKTLTTGEGGVVVTDDPNLASIFRSLRNQGP